MKIGTWSLDNLFRPGGDSGPTGKSEYEAKLVTLAQTISELGPDESVQALARWYVRHGFTQGDREPHQWRRRATIRREPQ